ncbi:MAG: HAD-IA family hydrolase, partial [Chloroflexota bacterium]
AKYNLEEKAAARMDEFGVSTPWQAFVQVRMKYYADMLADPDVLRNNQWPHNVELLHAVREHGCSTALATMSHCEQVNYVVDTLELRPLLDFIATRDDVNNGKPDPEIYNLVRGTFGHPADTMLVIEDSPSGVKAAIAAGMHVIAVSTPFTMEKLRTETDMDGQYIVDDPADLMGVVKQFVAVAE